MKGVCDLYNSSSNPHNTLTIKQLLMQAVNENLKKNDKKNSQNEQKNHLFIYLVFIFMYLAASNTIKMVLSFEIHKKIHFFS